MQFKDWLNNNKSKIVLSLICVLTVVCFYVGFQSFIRRSEVRNKILTDLTDGKSEESNFIYIDIKGAVKNPGLYKLRRADRLNDAVEAAGGFTDDADRERVNLASFLEDGSEIIIPSVSDGGGRKGGKININTAGVYELMTLDGIGEGYAKKIIEYREKNGAFLNIEQIKNVSGIGTKQFEKIKDYITVQ